VTLKIYNCDFGITVNGTKYEFSDVGEVTIEDPEKNRLTRGSNGKNVQGLVYKEGVKEPKKWTSPILNMSADLKGLLDSIFIDQTRVEVWAIDRTDGSGKTAKNAVLCNRPQQLTLNDTPDSMNVQLEFESFDINEVHKS
jgi:hypothetical protein